MTFGCSGVSPDNTNIQELYKLLGFEDKNQNGSIDKRTLWQRKDEGYIPQADLNGDGKIVEAEAKFYLHNLENINPSLKMNFLLCGNEKALLLPILKKELETRQNIDSREKKMIALENLLSSMVKAGLYQETIDFLDQIAPVFMTIETRREIIRQIVVGAFANSFSEETMALANSVSDPRLSASAYVMIAIELNKNHSDRHKIVDAFQQALKYSLQVCDTYDKSHLLMETTLTMVKMHFYQEAIDAAFLSINNSNLYPDLIIGKLADAIADTIAKETALLKYFTLAIETVKDRGWKEKIILDVMLRLESTQNFAEAQELVHLVKTPKKKASALQSLAINMHKTGSNIKQINKLFLDALKATANISEPKERDFEYFWLAIYMAGIGYYADALQAANLTADPNEKAKTLEQIARNTADKNPEQARFFFDAAIKIIYANNGINTELISLLLEGGMRGKALTYARSVRNPRIKAECLTLIALDVSEINPKESLKLFNEAIKSADRIINLRVRAEILKNIDECMRNSLKRDKEL